MHISKKEKWDESYERRENFVFYPHEEVIRFVSKNIRRRVGLNTFEDVHDWQRTPRMLALGCGIGRHVIFAHEMNMEGYGIDLSEEAVQFARRWANQCGMSEPESRILQGSVDSLPWSDGFFDAIVSHGVLDSMSFEVARATMKEAHRVLGRNGLFYCDLVSGDDSEHAREYAGEEEVSSSFEYGTTQSYFNYSKVQKLISKLFEEKESILVRRENVRKNLYTSRYHLILRKKG